jgi:hypothetical protein
MFTLLKDADHQRGRPKKKCQKLFFTSLALFSRRGVGREKRQISWVGNLCAL